MTNGIRTGDPRGFNKWRSSKFCEGSRVRQTPEEGRRTYWQKRCRNNNKDEDNSPKTLNDKINKPRLRNLDSQYINVFSFPLNNISIPEKKKKHKTLNIKLYELFLHMLLKFEIIWTRICQIIRLGNYINLSETLSTS